jgi:hypothetical protein
MTNVPTGNRLVNIGTVESPILVPEAVVLGDGSDQEREWWDALAAGSVILPDEALSKLLIPRSVDAKKGE